MTAINDKPSLTPLLDELIEAAARRSLGIPPDWTYRDVDWCPQRNFDALMRAVPKADRHEVARTTLPGRGVRGQYFWSPAGEAIRAAWLAARGPGGPH